MTIRQKHYRAVIAEALRLGVTKDQVAEAVNALLAEPDLDADVLRQALHQYIPNRVVRRLMADQPSSPARVAGLSSFESP